MVEIKEDPIAAQRRRIWAKEEELKAIVAKYPKLRCSFNAFVPGEYGLSQVHNLRVQYAGFWYPFTTKVLDVNFFDENNGQTMGDLDLYFRNEMTEALAKELAEHLAVRIQLVER